jgi:superfamily II DNA/RNA helicase
MLCRLKGLLVPDPSLFDLVALPSPNPPSGAPAPPSPLPAALAAVLGGQALNEMQRAALPALLGGRRNLIVGAKTGAGKTRLAEIALVEAALHGDAGLFLAPMRAIAGEKQADWQRFEAHGLRVYKTTGDDEAYDPERAAAAQIIVTTPERLESLIRNRRLGDLMGRLRVAVVDEIHLVGDGRRGAVLEALLTRLGAIMPRARLIGMSGTVPNIEQLAAWLDAEVFTSDWRPLPIDIHIHTYKPPRGRENADQERTTFAVLAVGRALAAGGASIVFCGSRAGVEQCALAFAEHDLSHAVPQLVALRAEHRLLAEVLARGVGFHHAGLSRADRELVEGLYRDGLLRVLVATSTVAAGVNLPASQVVVRDVRVGHDFIGSAALLQMCGRAGRVGLAESGEALIIASERDRALTEQALAGEAVPSMLGEDLATPLCTEVALGLVRSSAEAAQWYASTLHGRLTPNAAALEQALQTLFGEGFILARPDGTLVATPLGHATSSLMVRVETALRLERFLRGFANPADADALEEELLRTVCSRSDEWGESVASADAGNLGGRLAGYDAALAAWAPLRLRAFAAGACVLSGVGVQTLELPDSAAAAQTARNDLPRLLGFLSRRATERREPLPHVALAAEDLSLSLRAALPLRGQAIHLAPLPEARLEVRGRLLWLAGVPEGMRCWVRLSASSDDYALAPTLSGAAAPLASLAALGAPGAGAAVWATVVTREAGRWSHAALHIQVQVPHGRDERDSLAPCRHNWKVLGAYAHPTMRRLKLARYLATGAGKAASAPARPRRRALAPDPAAGPCPTCGGPMARRKSGAGEFFGCLRFPACRGTREAR